VTKIAKVTVVGSGYVGMSLAVLLAQNNDVIVLDIDVERVNKINNQMSTVADPEIETFLSNKKLNLSATLNKREAYTAADFIIIATPTNFDTVTKRFDTTSVDKVVGEALDLNQHALVVIKSTVPVGHTESINDSLCTQRVVFSPEFLREGKALLDNLYPSRIIVGGQCNASEEFSKLLVESASKKDIDVLLLSSTEAEAVKLFANSYLAMRVAFFNELDSFALNHRLDTQNIISGVCLDERIGSGYNNPSFGYGGYCLPKDTKQLLTNYNQVPQSLISAIVSSNTIRKEFITNEILKTKATTVGFYRIVMKEGSDNFRASAILEIMDQIRTEGIEVILYEPLVERSQFMGYIVCKDIQEFKTRADLIVANRVAVQLEDVQSKVFSRDIFGEN
jgi:UDPglucose 6-dehydrogenase